MDKDLDLPKTKDDKENTVTKDEGLKEVVEEINKQEEIKKEQEKIEQINKQHEIDEKTINDNASSNVIKLVLIFLVMLGLLFGFMKFVEFRNKEEEPLTEDERILKVLKTRYGKDFTKVNNTTYKDSDGTTFTIETNKNAGSKLIIFDTYLNQLQVDQISNKINNILTSKGLYKVKVYLSPSVDCRFIGKCFDNEDYNKHYDDNTNEAKLAERSNNIVLSQYLNMKNVEFFNEVKFSINIVAQSNFDKTETLKARDYILDLFNELNDSDYKNYLGYSIDIKCQNGVDSVFKAEGKGTSNHEFYL